MSKFNEIGIKLKLFQKLHFKFVDSNNLFVLT